MSRKACISGSVVNFLKFIPSSLPAETLTTSVEVVISGEGLADGEGKGDGSIKAGRRAGEASGVGVGLPTTDIGVAELSELVGIRLQAVPTPNKIPPATKRLALSPRCVLLGGNPFRVLSECIDISESYYRTLKLSILAFLFGGGTWGGCGF